MKHRKVGLCPFCKAAIYAPGNKLSTITEGFAASCNHVAARREIERLVRAHMRRRIKISKRKLQICDAGLAT